MTELSHSRALTRRDGTAQLALPPPDHPVGDERQAETPRPPRLLVALFAIVPLLLLIGWGAWHHVRRNHQAAQAQKTTTSFVPEVRTTRAERHDEPVDLVLPGQAASFDQANLFARATGYVAERAADIGSRVRRGDLILRIAAPDLDQQLAQAEAQLGQAQAQVLQAQASLEQAQANTKLANVTKFRTTTLAAQGWETKQNADNSTANATVQQSNVDAGQAGVKVAEANFKAQLAMVQRLQALTAFERIVAPFDGVVTARSVDVGDLVSADAGGGTPLFTIQNDDVIRVSVQVPQSGAVGLHGGEAADVSVPELPSRRFGGTVSRNSVALQPSSRSLTAEVDVPNPDHALRPGLYVNVTFHIPRERPAVVVPADALVFNAEGMHVAVVDDDGTVHLRKVGINRDFGRTVELSEGLHGGERIAQGLPAGIEDGGRIRIRSPGEKKGEEHGKRTAARREGAG